MEYEMSSGRFVFCLDKFNNIVSFCVIPFLGLNCEFFVSFWAMSWNNTENI